jgi:hypothetical protein
MPRSNFLLLLLILWGTRLLALEALPLHNDEGLHLTRAVEVWNGHPFWAISDGKIINHWLIAAFYPQNAPVFAGRIATLFVSMIGLAAGCALAKRLSGAARALLAGGCGSCRRICFFTNGWPLAMPRRARWSWSPSGWRCARPGAGDSGMPC